MNNINEEVFGFGNENDQISQESNFNFDSISGLGESDYENEDLFSTDSSSNFSIENSEAASNLYNPEVSDDLVDNQQYDYDLEKGLSTYPDLGDTQVFSPFNVPDFSSKILFDENGTVISEDGNLNIQEAASNHNDLEELVKYEENKNSNDELVQPSFEDNHTEEVSSNDDIIVPEEVTDPTIEEPIEMSETPISDLEDLTNFEEEKVESTDISDLFQKVSFNVQEASDIFKKNTEMKQKIDSRFDELKKLQSEIEKSKKSQMDEVDSYKDEVLEKLTEKKEEIEKRLNLLKELQASLEKEKADFEKYRTEEQSKINKVKKEVQAAYDDRREELGHIEDVLRKQKDSLDEERSQLALDKIQYEADKNELANNLLKFNELVNSFTNGVNEVKE